MAQLARFVGAARTGWSHLNFRRREECLTLIDWLDARPGERILDIGCGNGTNDRTISASGARVLGIDIDDRPLAVARRLYEDERTTFSRLNADALDFEDASFDKVVSFCVIEHLADDHVVIAGIHRVLRPGGALVFSADSLSNPGITQAERDWHRRRYAVNSFYTDETVREALSRAGFDIEETRYILNTPLALALVRFSWALDRLPAILGLLRGLGYLALVAISPLGETFPNRFSRPHPYGLTLLVRARKRPV